MPPWVPVLVTVAFGIAGLVVQAILLAYFLGRMKEQQVAAATLVDAFKQFTTTALQALGTRLDAVEEFASHSREDRAALSGRMLAVERNTEGLQGVRESMAGLTATFEAHRARSESDMAHVNRSLEGVQRQLGNIATGGGGRVVMLGGEGS